MNLPDQKSAVLERVATLRIELNSSSDGRELVTSLAPEGMVSGDKNVVGFCDWQQFSQWPQSS